MTIGYPVRAEGSIWPAAVSAVSGRQADDWPRVDLLDVEGPITWLSQGIGRAVLLDGHDRPAAVLTRSLTGRRARVETLDHAWSIRRSPLAMRRGTGWDVLADRERLASVRAAWPSVWRTRIDLSHGRQLYLAQSRTRVLTDRVIGFDGRSLVTLESPVPRPADPPVHRPPQRLRLTITPDGRAIGELGVLVALLLHRRVFLTRG